MVIINELVGENFAPMFYIGRGKLSQRPVRHLFD